MDDPLSEPARPTLRPIRESVHAVEEFGPFAHEGDLLEQLDGQGRRVQEIVPDAVGLSIEYVDSGATFTLVAGGADLRDGDHLACLDGGSCRVLPVAEQQDDPAGDDVDVLDEDLWRRLAEVTAARGVLSSLSMPLLEGGVVVGGVNLYGGSAESFAGHHLQLAEIFGAWAPGAVTNADLSFSTLREAMRAPSILQAEIEVGHTAGLLAAARGMDPRVALRALTDAAGRAGIPARVVAGVVRDLLAEEH